MKQVSLVNGAIAVIDVPAPACRDGGVLVRVHYSLISTGTETATTGGGQGLLQQAVSNPQLVRQVLDKVSAVGVRQTADLVRARRRASLALGYSAAGRVVAVGRGVTRFRVSDRVACSGAGYANHAEYDFVPENLLSLVPDGVPTADAAFTTLGAIALQGVRRLTPTLGEQIVVVGLGLIGQMASQVLKSAGCRVLGVDVRPERLALARELGAEAVAPSDAALDQTVLGWTSGVGADGVIVCASGGDVAMLNRSFEMCRRKGRVVLVGDVPIRISRDRIYRKELDFFISSSYGPGRYDAGYEEGGLDYPIGYVRWTEGRNFAEVLRLMAAGDLRVSPLVAASVPVDRATDAYTKLQGAGAGVAVLLDYGEPAVDVRPPASTIAVRAATPATGRIMLGIIGAGIFYRSVHQPNLAKHGGFFVKTLCTRSALSSRDAAIRAQVASVTTDPAAVLDDPDIHAVLIATRHDQHATLAIEALQRGKHVFVEKPLGLTVAECEDVLRAVEASGRLLTVGFNRRFSPLAVNVKRAFDAIHGPRTVLYRVNAGVLAPDHWLRDPVQGGGRLRGEGVHFFDFVRWLIGHDVRTVTAVSVRGADGNDPDGATVSCGFADGSVATVVYCGTGSGELPKERIEMFGGGQAIVLDDFRRVEYYGVPGRAREGGRTTEKGHFQILENFHDAIRGTAPLGVDARDGYWATWCAEQALRAMTGTSADG